MLVTVILLSITYGVVQSSGIHPIAPEGSAPVVTAASSQYFERTFNRLVAAPPVLQPVLPAPIAPAFPITPVLPFAPARPIIPVLPSAPAPPVLVDASRTVPTSAPVNPTNPPQINPSVDPNIAIAVATAHAAAPVATILLPPYPFGFPPSFGLIPQPQETETENTNTKETTTKKTLTTVKATTTQREEDATTPVPSNIDNTFAQALPSNDNFNFRQYLTPQLPSPRPGPQQLPAFNQRPQPLPLPAPRPQDFPVTNQRPQQLPAFNQRPQQLPLPAPRPHEFPGTNQRPQQFTVPAPRPQQIPQQLPLPELRPQKIKTHVEVVPVPLAYIAPPSPHHHEHHHDHHHHQHHHHHHALKAVPHIHTYIPKTSTIIIRPLRAPLRIKTIRIPAGFATYGPPRLERKASLKYPQNIMSRSRDAEPTTLRPINKPINKPPRV